MTKEIITQLKSRRAELMTELSRIERAIVALDAAPAQVKPRGRTKGARRVSGREIVASSSEGRLNGAPGSHNANGHSDDAGFET